MDDADTQWLERATSIARRGSGGVRPNPLVGCVLVRDGEVVAEGYHSAYGGPHAEVVALTAAGPDAQGATAFVSLEPCAHDGKTPPCADALVRAGVRRVVFGAADPTDSASGGAEVLRAAGVEVKGPCYDVDRSRLENPAFFHWADKATPWIQVKLATSLDGKIAAAPGARTAISGAEATEWVHRLRASVDAVMVGRATAVVDDPLLTVRHGAAPVRPPIRVVVDTHASLPPTAAMLSDGGGPVLVIVGQGADQDPVHALEEAGAEVEPVPERDGHVDLVEARRALGERGVQSVLCEGGGELASALIGSRLVERIHLIVAPTTLGPTGVAGFTEDASLDSAAWRPFDALRASGGQSGLGRDALLSFRREY